MNSITATEARKQLYSLLDDVAESHHPIQVTGKRSSAILISEEDWRAIPRADTLLRIHEKNPYHTPPSYEKLVGDFSGACSRRINIQHRPVYQILDNVHTVKVLRMWTHYE